MHMMIALPLRCQQFGICLSVWYPPGVCDLSWVHQTSTAGALVAFLQLELGTNTPGLAALDNWPVLEIPTESSGVDHFDHLPLEILRL